MRGDGEPQVLLVSIVAALLLLSFTAVAQKKFFGDNGLYDTFSKPILTGSEDIVSIGADKYLKQNQNFLDKVNSIFSGDPIEARCTRWYSDCGGKSPSPWNHMPGITEADYKKAVPYLQCTNTDAIKTIEENWAKSDSSFNSRTDSQKIELARNACKINLLNQISQQEALREQN